MSEYKPLTDEELALLDSWVNSRPEGTVCDNIEDIRRVARGVADIRELRKTVERHRDRWIIYEQDWILPLQRTLRWEAEDHPGESVVEEVKRLVADNAKLREALQKCGQHQHPCPKWSPHSRSADKCDCGLEDALAAKPEDQ